MTAILVCSSTCVTSYGTIHEISLFGIEISLGVEEQGKTHMHTHAEKTLVTVTNKTEEERKFTLL